MNLVGTNSNKLNESSLRCLASRYLSLGGEFSARQAKQELVKYKIFIFPTGLEVHLEEMF